MTHFGRTITSTAIGVVAVLSTAAAQAVPVIPNFTQGSMSSHTETTSTVTEVINSMDYSTGYQYSATGTGVTSSGTGETSKPTGTQTTPGAATETTETYSGPGLQTHTIIQRETTITSVTDTTSIFQQ